MQTLLKVFFSLFPFPAKSSRKLTFLYLANDVIQNSKRKGPEFTREFESVLVDAFSHVARYVPALCLSSAFLSRDLLSYHTQCSSAGFCGVLCFLSLGDAVALSPAGTGFWPLGVRSCVALLFLFGQTRLCVGRPLAAPHDSHGLYFNCSRKLWPGDWWAAKPSSCLCSLKPHGEWLVPTARGLRES